MALVMYVGMVQELQSLRLHMLFLAITIYIIKLYESIKQADITFRKLVTEFVRLVHLPTIEWLAVIRTEDYRLKECNDQARQLRRSGDVSWSALLGAPQNNQIKN